MENTIFLDLNYLPLDYAFEEQGTLASPKGVKPLFSLRATVNWMRGLAILVENENFDISEIQKFYQSIECKRKYTAQEKNTIFEQLVFALHQCSALDALCNINSKADIVRVATVAWYYGIYASASAMIVAHNGSLQNDHTNTANCWYIEFARHNRILSPFNLHLETLVKKDTDAKLKELKEELKLATPFNLANTTPYTPDEATAACHAYLSGSVDWWRRIEEGGLIKNLGVSNFQTKEARELRDERLKNKRICFLHQAIRFRGKANYRDSLFLGYGRNVENEITHYTDDLSTVLKAFVTMAGIYCSKRIKKGEWNEFMKDLEMHKAFSLSPRNIWGMR